MTNEVYQSLKNLLAKRKEVRVERIVDGYSGFLLLTRDRRPKVALHIESEMRWVMKHYAAQHPDEPLPKAESARIEDAGCSV